MKEHSSHFVFPRALLALITLLTICNSAHAAPTLAEEERSVAEWRTGRIDRLTNPTGWLTLVGLYWLTEGTNSFGRAEKNALMLDHPAMPASLGSFVLSKGKVTFTANKDSVVTHKGTRVSSIAMAPDSSGEATTLNAGSIQFYVIERAGKLGIRVRDTEHPARKKFRGIDYFPISTDWVFDAKFEPYSPIRHIEIINILGMTEKMEAPGAIVFTKDGKQYRLDAILEAPDDKELFIMFADATSARETYGAGRFIYIPLPTNGHTTLDFNKAYNPPCAFNDFATCPLPPWQNRLSLRVEAGEKKYSQPAH
jgi:uncharacterized protein (DUF1684 family)